MYEHRIMIRCGEEFREVGVLKKGEQQFRVLKHPLLNYSEDGISNILSWRESGYKGQGLRIAVLDQKLDDAWPGFHGKVSQPLSFSHEANEFDEFGPHNAYTPSYDPRYSHGHTVTQILHDIAPEADIFVLPYRLDARTAESYYIYGRIPDSLQWCQANNIQIVSASLVGTDHEEIQAYEAAARDAGIMLITSAGNRAEEGGENTITPMARAAHWLAVGSARFDKISRDEGVIDRYHTSSYGEELVTMQFGRRRFRRHGGPYGGHIPYGVGTSLSCPVVSGMVAMWYQRHYEINSSYPTPDEAEQFIVDNCHYITDQGQDDFSIYFGHGLFKLPELG